MRILIAEDELVARRVIKKSLETWGYEVIAAENGNEAWEELDGDDAPRLAILDWVMPGQDGIEVCRRVREKETDRSTYIILLTAKARTEDIVTGLQTGADDYIKKPFDRDELRARLEVGLRIIGMQDSLSQRVHELETALSHIKQLRGLLPICSYCKAIRNESEYWEDLESYLRDNSEADFSHSICPKCYEDIVKPEIEMLKRQRQGQ
ncbi:MAG: response regulator transcription factor [Planctomycetota bacterium]|nr:response regulator transcription factor [Planctomycetota bacterium]